MSLAAVLQIGSLGDSVVSTPVIRSLRERLPDCEDYLLVSRHDTKLKVMPADIFEMVWKRKHSIDYRGTGGRAKQSFSVASLLAQLRYYRPKYAVYLMPVTRSAKQVQRDKLFFRAGGVGNFVGFREMTAGELNHAPCPNFRGSESFLRFSRVWDELSEEKFGAYSKPPVFTPDAAARERVRSWLRASGVAPEAKLIALCPFSNQAAKNWPAESFAEVCRRLAHEVGAAFVVIGGSKDALPAQHLISSIPGNLNSCGLFSAAESAALLENCRLLLGVDSGPMHLAAGVGVPTVTVFSRVAPLLCRWFPLGQNHTVLYRDVACAGCRAVSACPLPDHPCLSIPVEDVYNAVLRSLGVPNSAAPWSSGTKVAIW